MPVCMCASVCVCVHSHKGKLLSTSNQGPNQHPIAHPHNLSLYLSLLLSSFPFPLPLPRTCFCILPLSLPSSPLLLPFPSSCTSLEMAAATVAAVVVVTWGCRAGGRLLGMLGTTAAQLQGQSSAFSVLVVMLEGEDTPGWSRICVPWEPTVTRPLANAMTLLKY